MTKQTIEVERLDNREDEAVYTLPSGFVDKEIIVTERACGSLTVNYKDLPPTRPVFDDDPQILDTDWVQAAEWGLYSPEDIQVDADPSDRGVIREGDEGALVRCWAFIHHSDARECALDRQSAQRNKQLRDLQEKTE